MSEIRATATLASRARKGKTACSASHLAKGADEVGNMHPRSSRPDRNPREGKAGKVPFNPTECAPHADQGTAHLGN